jgi:hypothetical protein
MKFYLPKLALTNLMLFIGLQAIGANAAEKKPAAAPGEMTAIEALYRLELLPQLCPGETCKSFSSYDRTGGNNDGFDGTHSKLRVENGNSILAEMDGPGCIQRMQFSYSAYKENGILGRKGEHIRIFLDGEKTAALDVPLEDLLRGKVDGFPLPLVGEKSGSFFYYVPIPYRKSCKVEVDGTDNRFYEINYRTFPNDKGIVTFHNPPNVARRKALQEAVKVWNACGDFGALNVPQTKKTVKTFSLEAGESQEFSLLDGPQMVRAVYLTGEPEQLKNAGGVRLQIRWDGVEKSAVDLPLDYFFCQAMQPEAFQSLLAGNAAQGWYNFMPMPYQSSAKITLKAEKPFTGNLQVLTVTLPEWRDDFGYFHTAYHESLPTEKGKYHPWLRREGRGRYVGTYLVTEGDNKDRLPGWLEGDDQFTVDGELMIHGTGTEDFFNCGWYGVPGRTSSPSFNPLHGFPVYRVKDKHVSTAAYRWNVSDPVSYEKSINAEIEHGPTNDMKADYRSAAFFYDVAP